jgi:hypothetical protein
MFHTIAAGGTLLGISGISQISYDGEAWGDDQFKNAPDLMRVG